jgi:hypothetical protein
MIVSPNPALISIEYHEAIGAARFQMSRELPLLTVLAIFAQVQGQLIESNPNARDSIFRMLAALSQIQTELMGLAALASRGAITPGVNPTQTPKENGQT